LLAGMVLAGLLAGGFLLAHFPPDQHVFYPRCSLHSWTGLHCPGCGSLRALHALTQGDLAGAMKSNLLLTAGAPVLLLVLATRWWRRRDSGLADGIPAWVLWFFLALVLVFGLVRNLPGSAFGWLGP
jgi:hypothetical protein